VETSGDRQWQKHCNPSACLCLGSRLVTCGGGKIREQAGGCGNSGDDPAIYAAPLAPIKRINTGLEAVWADGKAYVSTLPTVWIQCSGPVFDDKNTTSQKISPITRNGAAANAAAPSCVADGLVVTDDEGEEDTRLSRFDRDHIPYRVEDTAIQL
jgi:hypothetical protein